MWTFQLEERKLEPTDTYSVVAGLAACPELAEGSTLGGHSGSPLPGMHIVSWGRRDMSVYVKRHLIDPFIMPIAIIGVLAVIVITIGETLLTLFEPGATKDRLDRAELWFALGLSMVILFGIGFLATRPKGSLGPIDRDLSV